MKILGALDLVMVSLVLCLYFIQVPYMCLPQLATSTSKLHVFASICNFYKCATCFRLNPAVKFYFRMELISCGLSHTYLVSGFDKHGLFSGISHFLHHH